MSERDPNTCKCGIEWSDHGYSCGERISTAGREQAPTPGPATAAMSVEQMVREVLEVVMKDEDLRCSLANGFDPQKFTASDLVGPANRLNEILGERRTPGPATAKLIRCIKADLEPTDKMLDAFLAEWSEVKP